MIGNAKYHRHFFFLNRQAQNSENNIELGGYDLCGEIFYGNIIFFEESGFRKNIIGSTHGCKNDGNIVLEKVSGSIWTRLFACVRAYASIWIVLNKI